MNKFLVLYFYHLETFFILVIYKHAVMPFILRSKRLKIIFSCLKTVLNEFTFLNIANKLLYLTKLFLNLFLKFNQK